jgi:LysR family transcriptional repressor of citA
MDLEWVETFLVAAEVESFREAARRRFISQAAVSQQMAHLESEVGRPLFRRIGRRVELSEEGERFRLYAVRMVALWREAARAGGEVDRPTVLGAAPLLAETVVPWLARNLLAAMPGLDLVVRVGTAETLSPRDVDGILARDARRIPDADWITSTLWTEPVALFVGGNPYDLDGPPPDAEEVLGRRLLVDAGAPYNEAVMGSLRHQGFSPRLMTVDQVGVAKRLVEEGLAAAVLPLSAASREVAEGRLVEVASLDLAGVVDTVFWAVPRDRMPGAAAKLAARLLLARRSGAR